MDKTSTLELIKYAYNETRLSQTVSIRNAIDSDPLIENEYKELLETIHVLDDVKLIPSEETIKNILAKAKYL